MGAKGRADRANFATVLTLPLRGREGALCLSSLLGRLLGALVLPV